MAGRSGATIVGKVVEIALVAAATLVVSEALFRLARPAPRLQVTRPEVMGLPHGFEFVDGQPLWPDYEGGNRRNEACPKPGTINVLLLGTSVTYGVTLPPESALGPRMQAELDAREPGRWCVLSAAEPAYRGGQKEAELHRAMARQHVDVVLWEMWGNDPDHTTMVGANAYSFGPMVLGPGGLPRVIPMPIPLEQWLFERSRLYQYTVLTLGRQVPDRERWARYPTELLPRLVQTVEQGGGRFALYAPTRMDAPLAELVKSPSMPEMRAGRWIRDNHVPLLRFAEVLKDSEVADVALDPAGHLNPEGFARLTGPMVDWLTQVVLPPDARPRSVDAASSPDAQPATSMAPSAAPPTDSPGAP